MRAGCVAGCPGCRYTRASYASSLEQKRHDLLKVLPLPGEQVEPFQFEPNPFDYRRKALLFPNQNLEWGLRKPIPGTYDLEVIPIPECPVHSPKVRESVQELERLRTTLKGLPVFAALILEDRVGLIFKSSPFALPEELEKSRVPSLWACFHPSAGDRVMDHRGWRPIRGPFEWQDEGGHWVSFGAFTQQRLALHAASLSAAHGFLDAFPAILDLYCGTGRSLARWKAQDVMGIELSSQAIECAKKNAPHASVLQGKAEHRVPQIREWLQTRGHVGAFLNPPRQGVHGEMLALLNESHQISRLAYLSCSPQTLARDLSLLSADWKIRSIVPYDFFPWARHYEVLTLLERKT